MKVRREVLALTVIVLAVGVFLYLATFYRETQSSSQGFSLHEPIPGGDFAYYGLPLTPSNSSRSVVVGISGAGDLILLKGSVYDFDKGICPLLPPTDPARSARDCAEYLGHVIDPVYNLTILETYLLAHPSDVLLSRTIVDENVTVDSPVSGSMNVTIVLAHLGSGTSLVFWKTTFTQQTVSYPMLGYVEHGSFWTLPNIALGIIGIGAAGVVGIAYYSTTGPKQRMVYLPERVGSSPESGMHRCPGCGLENLAFAEKCGHCGRRLNATTMPATAPLQAN